MRLIISQAFVGRVLCALLIVSAAFFLLWRAWHDPDYYPVDFKYLWLAGRLWLEGGDPYGPEFIAFAREYFPDGRINPFFYPPSWRVICSALALAPASVAAKIWALLSLGFIAGSCCAIALTVSAFSRRFSFFCVFALVFFAVSATAHSAEFSIVSGQTSPLILLGVAGLALSLFRPNGFLTAACLAVLMLKPQIGLPVAFAALLAPSLRLPALLAGGATALLAGYGLSVEAPFEAILHYKDNLSLYGTLPENRPEHMSGLNFILHFAGLGQLSPIALLALACAAIGAAAFWKRRSAAGSPACSDTASFMALALASALFFMPTHNMDFLAATATLVLFLGGSRATIILAGVAAFFFMRSMSLAVVVEQTVQIEKTIIVSLFDTAAALLLLIGALRRLKEAERAQAPMARAAFGAK